MMSITRHVILNYVDTPLRILFWTVPELLILIVPLFLGLVIDQLILGVLISVISFWGNKKYQQRFGKGQIEAVKYWFFPRNRKFKSLPPSFVREYVG